MFSKNSHRRRFSVLDEISWIDKISNYLEGKFSESLNHETGQLNLSGWGVLVVSAFVDSINPCAFGVLIFLMLSLLKMGSSKRALKAGLTYTFVVFVRAFCVCHVTCAGEVRVPRFATGPGHRRRVPRTEKQ